MIAQQISDDIQEMNRRSLEAQIPTLMNELEIIFRDIDEHVKNRVLDMYLCQRLHSSYAAQLLMRIGSRSFPRLGAYLCDTINSINYPGRKPFWAMLINMMCMEENIIDKPLALSTFDEWVEWLVLKYPMLP